MAFTLDKFRDHIGQEKRRQRFMTFCDMKNQREKEKMHAHAIANGHAVDIFGIASSRHEDVDVDVDLMWKMPAATPLTASHHTIVCHLVAIGAVV